MSYGLNLFKCYKKLVKHNLPKAQDREDDDGREERCSRVDERNRDCVFQRVLMCWVVTGERQDTTESQTGRIEDLRSRFHPDHRVCQFFPLQSKREFQCELMRAKKFGAL